MPLFLKPRPKFTSEFRFGQLVGSKMPDMETSGPAPSLQVALRHRWCLQRQFHWTENPQDRGFQAASQVWLGEWVGGDPSYAPFFRWLKVLSWVWQDLLVSPYRGLFTDIMIVEP